MIRLFLKLSFIFILLFSVVLADAEARRFGGGRSVGMSRSFSSPSSGMAAKNMGSAFKSNTAGKWMGPLMGLAAGALIGSLLMGHGLGSGMLAWGAIIFVVIMLMKFLSSRKTQVAPHMQYNNENWQQQNQLPKFNDMNNMSYNANQSSYPQGFDANQFLRDVKAQFIRLQDAYDKKDLNDIREFTTPEMFAEIQLQIQERGQNENYTEVVAIDAVLLDVQNEFRDWLASVKFKGQIREERNMPAIEIDEVWHFKKDVIGSKWIVAGIEQSAVA